MIRSNAVVYFKDVRRIPLSGRDLSGSLRISLICSFVCLQALCVTVLLFSNRHPTVSFVRRSSTGFLHSICICVPVRRITTPSPRTDSLADPGHSEMSYGGRYVNRVKPSNMTIIVRLELGFIRPVSKDKQTRRGRYCGSQA